MDDVKSVIIRELKYRHPNLVNAELISNFANSFDQTEYDNIMNKVYVFPCFLKPGR